MLSQNRQTSGSWVRVVTGLGAGTYTTNVPDAQSYQFSYTGFGSSGPPPWILPTPGTYSKTSYFRPKGYKNESKKNQYGTPTSVEKSSGVHSFFTLLGSGSGIPGLAYDAAVRNEALSDFYENLRSSESNLALTLGEGRESMRMLRAVSSLGKIISLARQARRLAVRNPSVLISNVWLSMKYGWLPLYSDVWNYLDWQYRALDDGIPIRGRSQRTYNSRHYGYRTGLVSASKALTASVTKYKCEVKCWVGVQNSDLYNLSRVTSLNPVSIAWELVPFSFVVDWFVDVGGYLQNLEASLGTGLTFKRGYQTQVVHQVANSTASGKWTNLSLNPPYNTEISTGEEFYSEGHVKAIKERTSLTSFPRPTIPSVNVRMGVQRIMSAASLLRTILLGRVR